MPDLSLGASVNLKGRRIIVDLDVVVPRVVFHVLDYFIALREVSLGVISEFEVPEKRVPVPS